MAAYIDLMQQLGTPRALLEWASSWAAYEADGVSPKFDGARVKGYADAEDSMVLGPVLRVSKHVCVRLRKRTSIG